MEDEKKPVDLILLGALPDAIGEQEDAGFFVLSLPGVKEAVGNGEGEDIVGVDGGG